MLVFDDIKFELYSITSKISPSIVRSWNGSEHCRVVYIAFADERLIFSWP